jgi:methyl-accepting chemotaxis protein
MAESQSRRTYLIDRPFQLRYILVLAAWGAALAALFGLWAWQAHQQAAEILARAPGNPALLRQADQQLLWALAGIGALSAGALALLGFVVTHRVAGPIWVMGHTLGELARGRYPARRGLRRGDALQALQARFNEAVEALEARDRRTLGALEEALARLRPAVASDPRLAQAADALEREARERREALGAKPE